MANRPLLVAGYCVYGSWPSQSMASLKGQVDRIVFMPGRFWDYEVKGAPYSKPVFKTEAAKRTALLNLANPREGDWFFYIDPDEVLEGEINRSLLKGNSANVKMLLADGDTVIVPRFLRYREGMTFETHYLVSLDGRIVHNFSFLSETFNKRYDLPPYAAVLRHCKEKPTPEWLAFQSLQRRQEKTVEKTFRAKGWK